jgi:hypothetical protein
METRLPGVRGHLSSAEIGVLHRDPRRITIRKHDRQPGTAIAAVFRHRRHPLTSQRMPRVGDFHFCWKSAGVVLQCVTDFKQAAGLDAGQVIR